MSTSINPLTSTRAELTAADGSLSISQPRSQHWLLVSLIVFGLIVWFGGLELRGLFFPDEGRYAEIPLGMLTTGDWITPRLNGLKYFEKPPLQYWATAAIYAVFGTDEWTARLWPALTGFLGIVAVGFAARKLYCARTAIVAAIVLMSCWAYFLGGQYLTLDMGLTFFLTVALMAFLWAQQDATAPRIRRYAMYLTWIAVALAVLSKGLVALVLPTLAVVAYSLSVRSLCVWRRLHMLGGLALLMAITLPWFVAVQLQNSEFFQFFFIKEHFQRFGASGHHRLGAWYYFIVIGVAGMLPWSTALWAAVKSLPSLFRRPPDAGFHTERFLLIWVVVIFVFFSISKSKLPAYVLPAFPALALLASRVIVAAPFRAVGYAAVPTVSLGIALLVLIPFAAHWEKVREIGAAFDGSRLWFTAAASMLLVGGGRLVFGAKTSGRRSSAGVGVVG